MRRLRIALCVLCLALLVPLLLRARQVLPLDTRPLVEEKYAGWSGVLRLWVFEGWPCGISPWLNRCVTRFEKGHPGVYIQPRFVDAGAMTSLNDSGILPPDMLLFPPGLLSSPEGLLPLEEPPGLRPALSGCGAWNGRIYAVPVALGGYLWAWNAGLVDRLPDTWRDGGASLAVPPPEPWRRWDAALLALCSKRYSAAPADGGSAETDAPRGELDLGLGGGSAGTVAPAPTPTLPADDASLLSCRLPDGFQFDDDAWRRFINGEAAAMPVTQREVRRLQALSDMGRGPDWRLARDGGAFSDQLLCLAVADPPDPSERQALCAEFLAFLLTDECQGELHRASAFGVTDAASGYGVGDPLATMDAALRDTALQTPRCFDAVWTEAAEAIVRKFVSDDGEAPELWRRLGERLAGKPNDFS